MKKNHESNIDPNHTVESIIENGELNIIRTTPKAVTAAKKEARKNYEKNNQ